MITSDTHPRSTNAEHAAACRLYAAECALHVAHQTHVDAWIFAASEKLHEAVTEHTTVAAEHSLLDDLRD